MAFETTDVHTKAAIFISREGALSAIRKGTATGYLKRGAEWNISRKSERGAMLGYVASCRKNGAPLYLAD